MERPLKPIVRVTTLEKFRRFICDRCDDESEQALLDTVMGRFKGNRLTAVGTVVHALVENGGAHLPRTGVDGGYRFETSGRRVWLSYEQLHRIERYREELTPAMHEMRVYKDMGPALVTGCADLIEGVTIHDVKTRFAPVADAEYTDSYQWRYYLELFGGDEFHYDVFEFPGYKPKLAGDVRGLEMKLREPIVCYRYDGLREDCLRLLNLFLLWAANRGVMSFLTSDRLCE